MTMTETTRKRAPSARSLATRARIFDAAERLFAERGYDGASVRDIAAEAGVRPGLVGFHGGAKEDLLRAVVARRAEALSDLRLGALAAHLAAGATLRGVLDSCVGPLVDKATGGGPQWQAYARLMAMVSADRRWREVAEAYFDPTSARFVDEIARLFPAAPRAAVAEAYVFVISACLAACTARWRAEALSGDGDGEMTGLLDFCEGGMRAALVVHGAPGP